MGTGHEHTTSRRTQSRRTIAGAAAAALVGGAALVLAASGSVSGSDWEAKAVLRNVSGARVGIVRFEGDGQGTTVQVSLDGVTAGLDDFHGFHIHANAAEEPCNPTAPGGPFTNVGGHWNPTGATHAHHGGDMPSLLVVADGSADSRFRTGRFEPAVIAGRAVILHAGPDNFGNIPTRYSTGTPPVAGPDAATLATGDAGSRFACGVVVLD